MTDDKLCLSCREPLDYPSGEGCANMTAHEVSEPFHIAVEKVVEHEDGGATYSFEMDEKAAVNMAQIGLEFTVFCAAYQLDLQYVLNNLAYLAEKRDNSEDDK
jgi:hypothetical protein